MLLSDFVRLKTLPPTVSVVSIPVLGTSRRAYRSAHISLLLKIIPAVGSCDLHSLFHLLMSLYRVVDVAVFILLIVMPTMLCASLQQCTQRKKLVRKSFCLVIKMAPSVIVASLYLKNDSAHGPPDSPNIKC